MATKEIRLKARRDAREALDRKRKERVDQERRREALALTVVTALAERDALVADAERRAGVALQQLLDSGLSIADAVSWCDDLTHKDALRLVKRAATASTTTPTDAQPPDAHSQPVGDRADTAAVPNAGVNPEVAGGPR